MKVKAEDLSGRLNLEMKRNEEVETLNNAVEKDIAKLETQTGRVVDEVKDFDDKKHQVEAQLAKKNELVEALERKLVVGDEMKVEIGSLDKTLKESVQVSLMILRV